MSRQGTLNISGRLSTVNFLVQTGFAEMITFFYKTCFPVQLVLNGLHNNNRSTREKICSYAVKHSLQTEGHFEVGLKVSVINLLF